MVSSDQIKIMFLFSKNDCQPDVRLPPSGVIFSVIDHQTTAPEPVTGPILSPVAAKGMRVCAGAM